MDYQTTPNQNRQLTAASSTTLYGIMDSNGKLVNVKSRQFYITREDVRAARKSLNRKDVRIVRCQYVKLDEWATAK